MAGPTESAQLRYAWRVLSVVGMASVLTALGTSSLTVALPHVVRHFGAGTSAASWMLLSFMLSNTVLLVVFGRLADMFGRRTMYLWGLATYTLASLLLGFAPGAWFLVGLRVLQGAGAAMLLANSAALVTDAFPRAHLGRGMGIYIASFSVAQLIGPALGGLLTYRFGWQWVFWYNVPVGLACLAWGAVVLRRSALPSQERGMDLPGNVLVLVSLASLLVGLSQVGERGWSDPLVLGGLIAFSLLLPVFVAVERRSGHPVVDVSLFRDAPFTFGLLTSFLNTVARMAVVLLIALYFQAVHGEDAVSAGVKVLPLALASLIGSACSGLLQSWMSPRTLALLGTTTTTLGLVVLLVSVSPNVSYGPVAAGLVITGAGSGVFMPSNATALLHGLSPHRLGIVNAMRLMVQNTGVVVSTALSLSIVTSPLPLDLRQFVFAGTISEISDQAVQQLVTGYRITLLCMALISALAVVTSLSGRRATRTATSKLPRAREGAVDRAC